MICPICRNKNNKALGGYKGHHSIFSNLKIATCCMCELTYAFPMPTDDTLENYYQEYWKGDVASVTPSTSLRYIAQSIKVCTDIMLEL
jgi:hypothetical protein